MGRDHRLTGSARRDPRNISEGPRSRSLVTRAFDGIVQQWSVSSKISRDIPALSASKRRSAESISKNGEGSSLINELFKKEFINKLPDRAKVYDPGVPITDAYVVRPEHFVKPIKIHPRHGRSDSAEMIQVIGSPKRDSFERVRVIELPRTPRSPHHEKSKSPFADKFKDPEWIAKCEKLNVDHADQQEQYHHRHTFSAGAVDAAADSSGETSRDFMLSKFFDNPASKASPREIYDMLSTEDLDQLSADVLPAPRPAQLSFRRMPSARSILVEEEIAQRGKPLGKALGGDDPPRSSTSSSSVASGSRMTSPDLNADRDKDSPAAILRQTMARTSSRRVSYIDPSFRRGQEATGQATQLDYNSEEVIRIKEAMLKSLRAAAAVDQAHFLRTLQDQGAVQSFSPLLSNSVNDQSHYARSPGRDSESSSIMRSPMTPCIAKSPSFFSPSSARSENVREVRGNAVEGSAGGDFLARSSPSSQQASTPAHDRSEESKRRTNHSNSTIASRVAARSRRSVSHDNLVSLDKDTRKAEPLPLARAESAPKNLEWAQNLKPVDLEPPQNSSRMEPRNSSGKNSVLQKIERSRERRRKHAAKKEASDAATDSQHVPETPNEEERISSPKQNINHAASKSWSIATNYIFGGVNPTESEDVEDDVPVEVKETEEVNGNVKGSVIQKLMRRGSSRRTSFLDRQDSTESQDSQPEPEMPQSSSVRKQQSPPGELSEAQLENTWTSSSDHCQPRSSPNPPPEAGSTSTGAISALVTIQRSSSGNPPVSPTPSPKADDPGLLKSPLSSIESSSNAEDISGLLASLTGSANLTLGTSPTRKELDDSVPWNGGTDPREPQPSPEIELQREKLETAVQTPERALAAASGPCWSPGSDDSGSDGSSIDNQPSPVSVLNNSRTPFTQESKLGSIESKINLLDQKLQESHERSQKLSANSVNRRKDGVAKSETALPPPAVELICQEVKIVELNPEGTSLRKSLKPAKAAPGKCEVAKPLAAPSDERFRGSNPTPGYEHRCRSRDINHRHTPVAAVNSRSGVSSELHTTDFRRSLEIITGSASDFRKSLEIFDLHDIPTRGRRKWDMVYTRDVLFASGFGRDLPSGPMTKWHSVSEPIDPSLFEKMEDYYKNGQKFLGCERLRRLAFYQPDHLMLAERIKASVSTKQGMYEPMHRCHVFDVVNELLAKKLGPYRNPRNPWLKPAMMRPRPTGKMLLEEIWRDLTDQIGRNGSLHYDQKLLHLQLENLIGEDLYKRSQWFPSPDFDAFVERIVAELEKRIFHDLVLETVATLQSI